MIGGKYRPNYKMNQKIKKTNQKGQMLLIVILLTVLVLTFYLSLSNIAVQEIRTTKLEEESKKAFAAAEALLEERLRSNRDITTISNLSLPEGIVSGQAVVSLSQGKVFLSPVIKKDEQLTFYLSEYNPTSKKIEGAPYSGNLKFALDNQNVCSQNNTQVAIELTFINIQNFNWQRRLIDPCLLIDGETNNRWSLNQFYSTPIPAHLLILRVISASANFDGVQLLIERAGGNWPPQGRVIISSATTKTQVTKAIQLFQSYPQIPADFFVTRF